MNNNKERKRKGLKAQIQTTEDLIERIKNHKNKKPRTLKDLQNKLRDLKNKLKAL